MSNNIKVFISKHDFNGDFEKWIPVTDSIVNDIKIDWRSFNFKGETVKDNLAFECIAPKETISKELVSLIEQGKDINDDHIPFIKIEKTIDVLYETQVIQRHLTYATKEISGQYSYAPPVGGQSRTTSSIELTLKASYDEKTSLGIHTFTKESTYIINAAFYVKHGLHVGETIYFYYDVQNKDFNFTRTRIDNEYHIYMFSIEINFGLLTFIRSNVYAEDHNGNYYSVNGYWELSSLSSLNHSRVSNYALQTASYSTKEKSIQQVFLGIIQPSTEETIKKSLSYDIKKYKGKDFSEIFDYTFNERINKRKGIADDAPESAKIYSTSLNKDGIYIIPINEIKKQPDNISGTTYTEKLLFLLFNAQKSIALKDITYIRNDGTKKGLYEDVIDGSNDAIIGSDENQDTLKDFNDSNMIGSFIILDNDKILEKINNFLLTIGKFLHVLPSGEFIVSDLFFTNHIKRVEAIGSSIKIKEKKERYPSIEVIYPEVRTALMYQFPPTSNLASKAGSDIYIHSIKVPAGTPKDNNGIEQLTSVQVNYSYFNEDVVLQDTSIPKESSSTSDFTIHPDNTSVDIITNRKRTVYKRLSTHNTTSAAFMDERMVPIQQFRRPAPESYATYTNTYKVDRSREIRDTDKDGKPLRTVQYKKNYTPNYIRSEYDEQDPSTSFLQCSAKDAAYTFQKREYIYTFDITFDKVKQNWPLKYLPDYGYVKNVFTYDDTNVRNNRYNSMINLFKKRDFIVRLFIMKNEDGRYWNVWCPRLYPNLTVNDQKNRDYYASPTSVYLEDGKAHLEKSIIKHYRYKVYEPVMKTNGEFDLNESVLLTRLETSAVNTQSANIPFHLLGLSGTVNALGNPNIAGILLHLDITYGNTSIIDGRLQYFQFDMRKPSNKKETYWYSKGGSPDDDWNVEIDWANVKEFDVDANILYLDTYIKNGDKNETDILTIPINESIEKKPKKILCNTLLLTDKKTKAITNTTKYSRKSEDVFDTESTVRDIENNPVNKTKLQRAKDFHSIIFKQLYGKQREIEFESTKDYHLFYTDPSDPNNLIRAVHSIRKIIETPHYYKVDSNDETNNRVYHNITNTKEVFDAKFHLLSKKYSLKKNDLVVYKYKGIIVDIIASDFDKQTLLIAIKRERRSVNPNYNSVEIQDAVKKVKDISFLFTDRNFLETFNGDISQWNTSNVKNMKALFDSNRDFNQDIGNWDTGNVVDMSWMFYNASSFNQNLNNWDTSNVKTMRSMFNRARFNENISGWNTSNVTDMSRMFSDAGHFDQPLNDWDVSNVSKFTEMFYFVRFFNHPLNKWNVSSGTNFGGMFAYATSFNQPLDKWNVSNGTNFSSMFSNAYSFNQNINDWDVSSGTNFGGMFAYATSFNQPLDKWNVSKGTNFSSMFNYATSFNQNINDWDVSSGTYFYSMFERAQAFNQPLNDWDVSSGTNFHSMFKNATSFNQDLSNWDVSSNTHFGGMFKNATSFNQDLSNWDVSSGTYFGYMFDNATSFNQPIHTWTNWVNHIKTFSNHNKKYSAIFSGSGCSAYEDLWNYEVGYSLYKYTPSTRAELIAACKTEVAANGNNADLNLIDTSNITDFSYVFSTRELRSFNGDISKWDVSNGTNFSYMFSDARAFNQNINDWNVSNGTNFRGMFQDAGTFNQNINDWDVSNGTNFSRMFSDARAFNQPLNKWNVHSGTDFSNMFKTATSFNQNINTWDVSSGTNFSSMFESTRDFNQPLNDWDVSSGTNFSSMFDFTRDFNQPLNDWDVSNGTNFSAMFAFAIAFNQQIHTWTNWVNHVKTFPNDDKKYSAIFNRSRSGAYEDLWNKAVGAPIYYPTTNAELIVACKTEVATNGNNADLNVIDTSSVSDFSNVFTSSELRNFNGDISKWDVSRGTNFSYMFGDAKQFNGNIINWNVGLGDNFRYMFYGASSFNQDIGNWDVSGGGKSNIQFDRMFNYATSFNQDLSNWDISNGNNFREMFDNATAFNQNIGLWTKWYTELKKNIANFDNRKYDYIFQNSGAGAYKKVWDRKVTVYKYTPTTRAELIAACKTEVAANGNNANLNVIDTSQITDFSRVFNTSELRNFNGDISEWDTSNAIDMSRMFQAADYFNGDISNWDVSNVTNMYRMFFSADIFNGNIGNWNVGNVTNMQDMFYIANAFNQDIGNWDTKNVTNMRYMFQRCKSFNQDISRWNTSKVTDMFNMFDRAEAFNQNISNWDLSSVTIIDGMFKDATAFNQSVGGWTSWQTTLKNNNVPNRFKDNLFRGTAISDIEKALWDLRVT